MADLTAWDYLPDNKQIDDEDNELYPWLAPLIDWALPPVSLAETYSLDPLAANLGIAYTDVESYQAWFNLAVKPIIGTKLAVEFALKLMGIQGATVIEWYERPEYGLPKFKFIIEFQTFPNITEFGPFVELLYQIKNERSWLISIRMIGCNDRLEEIFAGTVNIEDVDGYRPDLGVIICLYVSHYLLHDFSTVIAPEVVAARYSIDIPWRGYPLLQVDQATEASLIERDYFSMNSIGGPAMDDNDTPILWT